MSRFKIPTPGNMGFIDSIRRLRGKDDPIDNSNTGSDAASITAPDIYNTENVTCVKKIDDNTFRVVYNNTAKSIDTGLANANDDLSVNPDGNNPDENAVVTNVKGKGKGKGNVVPAVVPAVVTNTDVKDNTAVVPAVVPAVVTNTDVKDNTAVVPAVVTNTDVKDNTDGLRNGGDLGGKRRPKRRTKKSKKGGKRTSKKSRGGSKLVSSPYTGGKKSRKSRGKAKK
jgi:hypothetical protein